MTSLPPGIERLPSGSYRATVSTPLGGRQRATFATEAEASEWRAVQRLQTLRSGRRPVVPDHAASVTLAAYWATWREQAGLEASTRRTYDSYWANHVGPHLGHYPIPDLTPALLDSWMGVLRAKGLSAATMARVLAQLSSLLSAACRDARLPHPVPLMSNRPRVEEHEFRVLEHAEFLRLLVASREPWRSLWLVLAHTGLRWGEVAALPVRNVNLDAGWVKVTRAIDRDTLAFKPPKNRKSRTVGLSPDATTALAALIDGKRGDELVFTGAQGGVMRYSNVRRRYWLPVIDTLGLPDPQPTIHDLRHTAASWMGEAGMPSAELAKVLGHASLRTVEIYVHASGAYLDRQRAAFSPVVLPVPR